MPTSRARRAPFSFFNPKEIAMTFPVFGGLPFVRPRTYVNGMPAIPDDFNEVMDVSIDAKHGIQTLIVPAAAFQPSDAATAPATVTPNSGYMAANMSAIAPIALPVGAVVSQVRVYIKDNSAPVTVQASIVSADKTGAVTGIGSSAVSSGDGSAQTLAIDIPATSMLMLAATHAYYVTVIRQSPGTGNVSIFSAEIDWCKP
jgi:hypothetical protein